MLFRQTTRSLTVLAPAKLNLFLRIDSRRPDGFHNLETVMTSIGLYDTLVFEEPSDNSPIDSKSPAGNIFLRVVDASARSRSGQMPFEAPDSEKNLVVRAARALQERTNCQRSVAVTLIKRIPSSAGMGGGSSDAAAALAGLNRFWNLRLSQADLIEIAARLGSDIAFFLGSSPQALCRGRGEILEPLACARPLHFVVAKPASGLSTPAVFKKCCPGEVAACVGNFVKNLESGNLGVLARDMHNGLQTPAEELNSDVKHLRSLFSKLPVVAHQMSGSGSSYFGICHSRCQAIHVASRLRSSGIPWVKVVGMGQ